MSPLLDKNMWLCILHPVVSIVTCRNPDPVDKSFFLWSDIHVVSIKRLVNILTLVTWLGVQWNVIFRASASGMSKEVPFDTDTGNSHPGLPSICSYTRLSSYWGNRNRVTSHSEELYTQHAQTDPNYSPALDSPPPPPNVPVSAPWTGLIQVVLGDMACPNLIHSLNDEQRDGRGCLVHSMRGRVLAELLCLLHGRSSLWGYAEPVLTVILL